MNLAAFYAAHKTAVLAAGGVGVVGVAVVAKKKRGSSSSSAPALGTVQNPATYDTTGTDVAGQLSDASAQFGNQLGAYQDYVQGQLDALQAAGIAPQTPVQETTTGVTTGGTTTVAATPIAPRPAPKLGKPKAIVRHPAPPKKKAAPKRKTLAPVRKAAPKPKPAPKKKATKPAPAQRGLAGLLGAAIPRGAKAAPKPRPKPTALSKTLYPGLMR